MPGNHASTIAGGVGHHLAERQRAAVEQHDRDRLAGGLDRGEQVLLPAGQVEVAPDLGLAALAADLAEREHDLVGALAAATAAAKPLSSGHSLAGS